MTRTAYVVASEVVTTYHAIPIPDDVLGDDVEDYVRDAEITEEYVIKRIGDADSYWSDGDVICDDTDPNRPAWAGGTAP